MVLATLGLPYWLVLRPAILKAGGIPVLTERSFGLLAAATVLTTLAGYWINDFYDVEIDAINKGKKRSVTGRFLGPNGLLFLYLAATIGVFALSIALYLALSIPGMVWPLWVFPLVSTLLFLYAWQIKCTPLFGNLLVALLCGVVPLLCLLPEGRPLLLSSLKQPVALQEAVSLVWMYAMFAFVTNLWREQVKDLEDFEGDAACGCHTLPVLRGLGYAKKPAAVTGISVAMLIVILLYFWFETGANLLQVASGVVFLLLPSLAGSMLLLRARSKKHFSHASLIIKILMLAGMVLLLRPLF
ncbi:MAG: UbiA family prenyltransferase [Saprospiraceae bacterium]|nr:UbiA family prenyltransferase [Saprospiraceae bacterium]